MTERRILLFVDEDKEIQNKLEDLLRPHAVDVRFASDGMLAIHEAVRQKPHLILLNVKLPGGGGLVVLERLKNLDTLSHIPVAMFTNEDRSRYENDARAKGAVDYISKRLPMSDVVSRILVLLNPNRVSSIQLQKSSDVRIDPDHIWSGMNELFDRQDPSKWSLFIHYLLESGVDLNALTVSARTMMHMYSNRKEFQERRRSFGYGMLLALTWQKIGSSHRAYDVLSWLQSLGEASEVARLLYLELHPEESKKLSGSHTHDKPAWIEKLKRDISDDHMEDDHSAIQLLDQLKPHEALEFLGQFNQRTLADGEILFGVGDKAEFLYFIAEGEIELFDSKAHRFRPILLTKGNFLGEHALLLNQPKHSMSARAKGRSEVLQLQRHRLIEDFLKFPLLQERLESLIFLRKFLNLAHEKSIFEGLKSDQMHYLYGLFRSRFFKPSQFLFKVDQPSQNFYVLIDGEVEVRQPPNCKWKLGPYEILGERSFLQKKPHQADAQAINRVRALECNRQSFDSLVREIPSVATALVGLSEWRNANKFT